ncbi:ER membrane glycoprotein subunit of the GPI transamidase complex-like protein [Bonamia ostreae]|uniref:GPI mannosyltransferase 2 n=1 Tax=Bonamia ostreae TaxID=126728 RepID=A0ABV2AM49_9EUKA
MSGSKIGRRLITISLLSILAVNFIAFVAYALVQKELSADAFKNESFYRTNFGKTFKFLSNWDGHYFLAIAERGYEEPSHHAFFPLYPLLIRFSASFLSFGLKNFDFFSLLLVSSLIISNTMFLLSVLAFYKLTICVFKDRPKFALKSSFLYSFNFARIFMSATYSESLFAFMSMTAFRLHLEKDELKAVGLFFLCTFVRSNGILFSGFYFFRFVRDFLLKRTIDTTRALKYLIFGFFIISPYFLWNFCGYKKYCSSEEDFARNEFCSEINFIQFYSFLQSKYWF